MRIESLDNPKIKMLLKLSKDSAVRDEMQQAFIEGKNLIEQVAPFVSQGTLYSVEPLSIPESWEWVEITPKIGNKLSQVENSENFFAAIPLAKPHTLKGFTRIIAFDRVSDPGNLGTLLRTAVALGWDGAFFLPGCCDIYNQKALRASKGAPFILPHRKGSWDEFKALLQEEDFSLVAADLEGELPEQIQEKKLVLILGNEGQGLSHKAKHISKRVTIPMTSSMESLNVACAGSILMYTLRGNHG